MRDQIFASIACIDYSTPNTDEKIILKGIINSKTMQN
jgi:hypothetical protein